MNYVGRKIYYEISTGSVIIDTGERQGDVIETTQEQDFQMYVLLNKRVPDTVGCIEIPYGQDLDKFSKYLYHVDIVTKQIVWDLTPIQQQIIVQQQTVDEKIYLMQKALDELILGGV